MIVRCQSCSSVDSYALDENDNAHCIECGKPWGHLPPPPPLEALVTRKVRRVSALEPIDRRTNPSFSWLTAKPVHYSEPVILRGPEPRRRSWKGALVAGMFLLSGVALLSWL